MYFIRDVCYSCHFQPQQLFNTETNDRYPLRASVTDALLSLTSLFDVRESMESRLPLATAAVSGTTDEGNSPHSGMQTMLEGVIQDTCNYVSQL